MAVYMAFTKFLDEFFPSPGKEPLSPEPRPRLSHKDVVPPGASETDQDLATRMAKLVNAPPKNGLALCPGFKVALGHGRWDPNTEGPSKVDAALYAVEDTPADGNPHWEKQRLLIEFTVGGTPADPFDDTDWSAAAKKRADGYIAHALALQQRTALFTLLMNGPNMRLARWDRSGAVYSELVNYVNTPGALRDVFWAFSRLGHEAQGLDTTATPLERGSAEFQLMDEFARPQEADIPETEGAHVQLDKASKQAPRVFAYVRRMFAESIQHDGPRYKLLVPKKNGKSTRAFLVGIPNFVAPGAVGRATRNYVALDLEAGRFVLLKDTWLPQCEDTAEQALEGDILKKLNQAEVKNVPTLVCHGELGQDTLTQSYWGSRPIFDRAAASYTEGVTNRPKSVSRSYSYASTGSGAGSSRRPPPPSLRMYRHYRIVVEEVAMPLCRFETGKQLVSAVKDSVDAHAEAYKCGSRILHRDVGDGNILILPTLVKVRSSTYTVEWKGLLTGWELAKCMPYIGGEMPSSRYRPAPVRMGTWHAFAAAHALDNPYAPAHVEDELESFLHILHYNGLRYLRHECAEVEHTLAAYYGEEVLNPSVQQEHTQYPYTLPRCEPHKRTAMHDGVLRVSRPPVWYEEDSTNDDEPRPPRGPEPASEFYVVDIDGRPEKHPLNGVLWTMMRWVSARYKADEAFVPPPLRDTLARNMSSHAPLRELLDAALAREWPDDDRVGDQLESTTSAVTEDVDGMAVDAGVDAFPATEVEVEVAAADPWAIEEEPRARPGGKENREVRRTEPVGEEPPSKRTKTVEDKKSVFPSLIRGLGLSRRGARQA